MNSIGITISVGVAGFLITWSCTIAWLTWWLSKQFSDSRHTMYGALSVTKTEILEELEKIEGRLDKHEDRIRKLEVEQASWPALMAWQERQKASS